jgi:TetR/AcrR family transcriptional regulator
MEVLMGVAERKEREKEQRRNAIIDAAEKVFFSKGIENSTMDEVAELAELSKGTLYLYFKNKNDLFHAIIARALDAIYVLFKAAAEAEKTGYDKIWAIGRVYYEFFQNEPDYFSAMLHQEIYEVDPEGLEDTPNFARCNELVNEIFSLLQETVKLGIQDGTVRKDLDPLKLSLVLWGHSAGILHIFKAKEKVFEKNFGITIDDIVEYSFQLISDYLKNKENKQ